MRKIISKPPRKREAQKQPRGGQPPAGTSAQRTGRWHTPALCSARSSSLCASISLSQGAGPGELSPPFATMNNQSAPMSPQSGCSNMIQFGFQVGFYKHSVEKKTQKVLNNISIKQMKRETSFQQRSLQENHQFVTQKSMMRFKAVKISPEGLCTESLVPLQQRRVFPLVGSSAVPWDSNQIFEDTAAPPITLAANQRATSPQGILSARPRAAAARPWRCPPSTLPRAACAPPPSQQSPRRGKQPLPRRQRHRLAKLFLLQNHPEIKIN